MASLFLRVATNAKLVDMSTKNTQPSDSTARTLTTIKASERQRWRDFAVNFRQSFPGTGNFDLIDNSFGLLMMHNDDIVNSGEGFVMHQHDNAEIVSWIMVGAVRHRNSSGKESVVSTGQSQAISAGVGIRHSEVNAAGYSSRDKLRVIQMWLPPDVEDAPPSHSSADFSLGIERSRRTGEFFTVATGDQPPNTEADSEATAPLHILTTGAELEVAYLTRGVQSHLPEAAFVHFFVAEGHVKVTPGQGEAMVLSKGDVLRVTNPSISGLHAPNSPILTIDAEEDAVIIAWRMARNAKDFR